MGIALQIEFHNTQPIEDVQSRIRQELAELEKVYNKIVSCHVDVEVPEHPRRGSTSKVQLDFLVPGRDVAELHGKNVPQHLEVEAQHKDPELALAINLISGVVALH